MCLIKYVVAVHGHLGIIDTTILIGRHSYKVAAVHNVCVLPQYRGKGFVSKIMHAAMKEASCRNYDFGMLFCKKHIACIYEKAGWNFLPENTVKCLMNDGSVGTIGADEEFMFYPLKVEVLPAGEIDLCGRPW